MNAKNSHSIEFTEQEQHISEIGKLLSHPARIRVVNLLLETKTMTSSEIAAKIPLARTTVLQHISALKDGGWLTTTSDGSTIKYEINSTIFNGLSNRLELFFLNCSKRIKTKTEPIKILFLCTGNSCRSQMAEAFINKNSDRYNVKAYSAGTKPSDVVQPMAIEVMAEKNIDLTSHHPKKTDEYIGDRSIDLVIIVCEQAEKECPYLFPHSKHKIFMPFKDPKTMEEFRNVRDLIEIKLQNLLEEL